MSKLLEKIIFKQILQSMDYLLMHNMVTDQVTPQVLLLYT